MEAWNMEEPLQWLTHTLSLFPHSTDHFKSYSQNEAAAIVVLLFYDRLAVVLRNGTKSGENVMKYRDEEYVERFDDLMNSNKKSHMTRAHHGISNCLYPYYSIQLFCAFK
ncbi:CLUMA_CG001714, isoform A [Clunio marinus]|uniref:CLUMA_CG001714, isoform A n=1 Tax=Clunio marinus TaxID=568069 RepID=A0A1J1HIQ1_9DIPT|nr:CLUMA_CG001714, isoform A [Clunio marinus]